MNQKGRKGRLRLAAVAAAVAIALGLTNCSNGGQVGQSSVTDAAGNSPLGEISSNDGSNQSLFPSGTVVSVTDASVNELVVDFLGNSVTVYGWAAWPQSFDELGLFEALGTTDESGIHSTDLFGNLAFGRQNNASLVAVDVEVCAALDQGPGLELFRSRFQVADTTGRAHREGEADLRATMIVQPLILPPFTWPEAGACQRGWQGLEWRVGDSPGYAQYTAMSVAEETFGEQHVYRWALGGASPATSSPVTTSPAPFELAQGEQGMVSSGSLTDWGITLIGWTEVGDTSAARTPLNASYFQPNIGHRVVATLVEACAGPGGDLPSFGLQVDGWNLVGSLETADAWGPGYNRLNRPSPGECATGWVPYVLPIDAVPSAMFATDRLDPQAPWLVWSFGEAMAAPEVGVGFPTELLFETVNDICGAGEPVAIVQQGEPSDYLVTSAVAVAESASRIVVYLSEQDVAPADIPKPTDPGKVVLQVTVENANEAPIIASEYRDDLSGSLYGAVRLLDGATPDRFVAFLGATVLIDQVTDDYVCGTVSNTDEATSVTGRFAAPIWRP